MFLEIQMMKKRSLRDLVSKCRRLNGRWEEMCEDNQLMLKL